mgnify:CR=1 FL=1
MNHLQWLERLNNSFFALRHGKSKPNEEGIIISDPEVGTKSYGLVNKGRIQVRDSIRRAMQSGVINKRVVIVSSDFKRAYESAEIAKAVTGSTEDIVIRKELRERSFGGLNGQSNIHYQTVWALDEINPNHEINGVESVRHVLDRTTRLIVELDSSHKGKTFILASHGDTLQILDTGFRKISPGRHRRIQHLETGELRELTLTATFSKQSVGIVYS